MTKAIDKSRGFIPLWRSFFHARIRDHKTFLVYLYLVAHARSTPTQIMSKEKLVVPLNVGEVYTFPKWISYKLGLAEDTIRACIKKLVTAELIGFRWEGKIGIICVRNFEHFMSREFPSNGKDPEPPNEAFDKLPSRLQALAIRAREIQSIEDRHAKLRALEGTEEL